MSYTPYIVSKSVMYPLSVLSEVGTATSPIRLVGVESAVNADGVVSREEESVSHRSTSRSALSKQLKAAETV